jgi:hypothetical protein
MIIAITRVIFYGNFTVNSLMKCKEYSKMIILDVILSSRFRKQLTYVLIDVHLKHWRERVNRLRTNQIVPEPLEMQEIPTIKLTI